MDFHRPNRHFQLSTDPRQQDSPRQPQVANSDNGAQAQPQPVVIQPQVPTATDSTDAVVSEEPIEGQQPASDAATEQKDKGIDIAEVDFMPAPPEVPEADPPVIESMQIATPEVVPEPEVVQPSSDFTNTQTVGATATAGMVDNPSAAQSLQDSQVKQGGYKEKSGVPTKFVVIGAVVMILLFAGSVFVQQKQIAKLKTDREALSRQVMIVNPVSAGEVKSN